MKIGYRSALVGLALAVGGLIAGTCHLFNLDSPRDIVHLSQYARWSAPLHLALFLGGLLVLLGWMGQYAALNSSPGLIGTVAFIGVFLGVLCGDLLHCILEFSIFPLLDATAPYALPGLADATYRSTMLTPLLSGGRYLLIGGMCATAACAWRGIIRPRWSAGLFAIAAGLEAMEVLPARGGLLEGPALVVLYFAVAILGLAILLSGGGRRGETVRPRVAPTCEETPPAVQ